MKVLFALPPSSNPLIQELKNSIEQKGVQVKISIEDFWNEKGIYDIIHIHWPEALCYWQEPDAIQLSQLKNKLQYWKSQSKCIITRHNIFPHQKPNCNFINLYQLVFQYTDAVVHMGEYSLHDYRDRYNDLVSFKKQLQVVIPHPVYASFPNAVSSQNARQKLGIPTESFVILVFGKVRNAMESNFIKQTFREVKDTKKILVVPHYYFSAKWINCKIEHLYHRFHPQYYLTSKRIQNEEAQFFFNAADVVFIQRFGNLNSGNLILGFSFGKVVVGPTFGVAGEILMQTNNPTFEPGNVKEAARALEKGKQLSKLDKGKYNREYAQQHWNHEKISDLHMQVYHQLLHEYS